MLDADRIVDIEVNIDRTPVPLRGQSDVYVQVRRTEGERRGEKGRDGERRGEKGERRGESRTPCTRLCMRVLCVRVYVCVCCMWWWRYSNITFTKFPPFFLSLFFSFIPHVGWKVLEPC